jgi:hypothetical protein
MLMIREADEMPVVYGYGEDALTFWVISGHLKRFLSLFGDHSPIDVSTVFYRPSFGRKGSSKDVTNPSHWRSAFGEFDAIVGTERGTYLIETKWTASSEAPRWTRPRPLRVTNAQVRRHSIMRSYIEAWRAVRPSCWSEFIQISDIRTRLAAFSASVPHPRTKLARHLEITLGLTAECGPVEDVLLFMRSEGCSPPGEVEPAHFTLVGVDCRIAESSGYLLLSQLHKTHQPDMWLGVAGRRRFKN